jgi:hypothetical protein
VTVSILDILAVLPSGAKGPPLTLEELGVYLRNQSDTEDDRAREKRHQLRDELFHDGGIQYMCQVIDEVFVDATVRELRKKWVRHSRFNNAVKRIIGELSTVYTEPARRSVSNATGNVIYQALLEDLQFDITAQVINRMLNLHRILLVGFRVRVRPDESREPVVDVTTPARFRLVFDPNDKGLVVGYLIRCWHTPARAIVQRKPEWVLWTDHEWVRLDGRMSPIESSYTVHGLGVCPWMLVLREPGQAAVWPGEEGEDLVAAQIAVWMSNLLLLKEAKSATQQMILSGDLSGVARGQVADSEVPGELPEGVSAQSMDRSMDLSMFQNTGDHVIRTVAANYGISAALLEHQGVQSADARELMRVPIRELRREQQPIFRRFERRFAELMVAILRLDDQARAFDTAGWRIDFGESATPLTEGEDLDLFEKKRRLALDNTIDYMIRRNPDLDERMAAAAVDHNIQVETERVGKLKQLQKLQGGVDQPMPPETQEPGAKLRAVPGGQAE